MINHPFNEKEIIKIPNMDDGVSWPSGNLVKIKQISVKINQ